MMFRDMMRSVCGAYCAAVMMCASGVLGMENMSEIANGIGETAKNSTSGIDGVNGCYRLSLDFSNALYYRANSNRISVPEWRSLFASIQEPISALLSMQTTTIDLESAFGSMFYISQYAFDAFVEYCTLDFKDEVAKSNVFMFLSLFPKVIEYCQPDASKDLIGEFTSFLLDRSQCGLPIVREEDRKLFLRVAEILEPCMSN